MTYLVIFVYLFMCYFYQKKIHWTSMYLKFGGVGKSIGWGNAFITNAYIPLRQHFNGASLDKNIWSTLTTKNSKIGLIFLMILTIFKILILHVILPCYFLSPEWKGAIDSKVFFPSILFGLIISICVYLAPTH